jgi:hypothetical protein
MALKKLYIDAVEGLTYITHPELHAGAEIFQVMREGKMRVPTTGTPTGKEFKHSGGETKIEFDADQPFVMQSLPGVPDPSGTIDLVPTPEVIYVKYKS